MAELFLRGKKVSELKLVEIKEELTKRNLPKKGNKASILKRLEKALLTEKLHAVSPDLPLDAAMGGVSPETCTHPGMEETVSKSVNASVSEAAQKMEDESSSQAQQSTLITSDIAIANPKDNAMEKIEVMSSEQLANEGIMVSTGKQEPEHHHARSVNENRRDARNVHLSQVFTNDKGGDAAEEGKGPEAVVLRSEGDFSVGSNDQGCPMEAISGTQSTTNMMSEGNEENSSTVATLSQSGNPADVKNPADIIEPSYPREEELIYEGDVDHEEKADEEEKDVLIVDINTKELDLGVSNEKLNKSPVPSARVRKQKQQSGITNAFSSCNLWVSKLAPNVSAADIKTFFSSCGQVESVKVVARASNKGERFAFVVMGSNLQARKTVEVLNGKELKGRPITVESKKSSPFSGKEKPKQQIVKEKDISEDVKKFPSESTGHVMKKSAKSGNQKDSSDVSTPVDVSVSSHNALSVTDAKTDTDQRESSASKRIVSVEGHDGKKELFTTHKKNGGRSRSRSPRSRRPSSPKGRIVSHRLSPARNNASRRRYVSPPKSHHRYSPSRKYGILPPPPHRASPHRHFSPPSRRLSSPSRRLSPTLRRLSPPLRRSPPPHHLSPHLSPRSMSHRRLIASPSLSSTREDEMFVAESRVHHRLGARMMDSRDVDLRLQQERERIMSQKDRDREAFRREAEIEHARKEQELLRQIRELEERETRGRDVLERQQRELQELQKTFREREARLEAKERDLKAREVRERDRLSALERQQEKEIREKVREEFQHNMEEREQRQKKVIEEHLRVHRKLMLEKEKKLKEQEERLSKYKEEMNRRQKEEEDKKERERRMEDERKERDSRNRGGVAKRSYNEDYSQSVPKRQAMDDSGVFGRLGGRDSHSGSCVASPIAAAGSSQQVQPRPVVKESIISNNVTYRRFESPKSMSRISSANPYSQNQSRTNKLNVHPFNITNSQSFSPPLAEPHNISQPFRYPGNNSLSQHYRSNVANVGYGGSAAAMPPVPSYPTPNLQVNKAVGSLLANHQEYLSQVMNNVKRSGQASQHAPIQVAPPVQAYPRRMQPQNFNMRGSSSYK